MFLLSSIMDINEKFPLVSIIIPVFNIDKYISKCIFSVIHQDYYNLEIIVVNDGSTDQSLKIIEQYMKKDFRINVISKKNQGLPSARKSGIEISKGEFIYFVDGDDHIEYNAISAMVETALRTKVDIVVSDYFEINESGKKRLLKNSSFDVIDKNQFYKLLFSGLFCWTIGSKLIRKICYSNFIYYDNISNGEDLIAIVQLVKNARFIAKCHFPTYNYLQRTTSITGQYKNKKSAIDILLAAKIVTDYLDNGFDKDMISEKAYINIMLLSLSLQKGWYKDQKETYKLIINKYYHKASYKLPLKRKILVISSQYNHGLQNFACWLYYVISRIKFFLKFFS